MNKIFAFFPLLLTACSQPTSSSLNEPISNAIAEKDAIGKMQLTQQKIQQDQRQQKMLEQQQQQFRSWRLKNRPKN